MKQSRSFQVTFLAVCPQWHADERGMAVTYRVSAAHSKKTRNKGALLMKCAQLFESCSIHQVLQWTLTTFLLGWAHVGVLKLSTYSVLVAKNI